MHLDSVLHLLPRDGAPSPLYIFLHGEGATALAMVQVADRFAQAYPQAAHLIPDGFFADDTTPDTRGWVRSDVGDASTLAERVASSMPALVDFVRDAQRQLGWNSSAWRTPSPTAWASASRPRQAWLFTAAISNSIIRRSTASRPTSPSWPSSAGAASWR